MDNVKHAELSALIACGKLDCLKGCCDNLLLVQAVLRDMSPRDLGLLSIMLCGCASGGQPTPQNPSRPTNTCFVSVLNFVEAHRGAIIAIESALAGILASISGKMPPEDVAAWALLASSLEALREAADNARDNPQDTGTLQKLANVYCALLKAEFAVEGKLSQWIDQSWVTGIMDMLDKINPARYVDKACCAGTIDTGINNPTVPATWDGGSGGTGMGAPATTGAPATGGGGSGIGSDGSTAVLTFAPPKPTCGGTTVAYTGYNRPSGLAVLTPFTPQTVAYPRNT